THTHTRTHTHTHTHCQGQVTSEAAEEPLWQHLASLVSCLDLSLCSLPPEAPHTHTHTHAHRHTHPHHTPTQTHTHTHPTHPHTHPPTPTHPHTHTHTHPHTHTHTHVAPCVVAAELPLCLQMRPLTLHGGPGSPPFPGTESLTQPQHAR